MLDYEWGSTPSHVLIPSSSSTTDSATATPHHHRQTLDPFSAPAPAFPPPPHPTFPFYGLDQISSHTHFHSGIDPRAFTSASYPPPPPSMDFDTAAAGFMMVPKSESAGFADYAGSVGSVANTQSRIGLNLGLGGRTYFSAAEEDFISRLYRRSRGFEGGSVAANSPRCQAEGCNADLTHAKHYHRRHKVCDFHSKASTVIAAGLTQRFCQQCSRFHVLTEFDNGKRSCRRRLADHNRRRRKSHQPPAAFHDRRPSPLENLPRPPPNSSAAHEAAVSPSRVSLDSLRSVQETCYSSSAASSSISTPSNSMFY